MPKDPRIKKVLVIGSGPIIIGQAAEFLFDRFLNNVKAAKKEVR